VIGIRIQNPLVLIIALAVMDFILVYWLGVFDAYVSPGILPTILCLWVLAIFSPDWRC